VLSFSPHFYLVVLNPLLKLKLVVAVVSPATNNCSGTYTSVCLVILSKKKFVMLMSPHFLPLLIWVFERRAIFFFFRTIFLKDNLTRVHTGKQIFFCER